MGATVVAGFFHEDDLFIAHMGDSIAWRVRNESIDRLTHDHTVVQVLIDAGAVDARDRDTHPSRNQLSRYMGMPGLVYPDVGVWKLADGDRFVLASDGLAGALSEDRIGRITREAATATQASCELVERAVEAEAKDDTTALVIDWNRTVG